MAILGENLGKTVQNLVFLCNAVGVENFFTELVRSSLKIGLTRSVSRGPLRSTCNAFICSINAASSASKLSNNSHEGIFGLVWSRL